MVCDAGVQNRYPITDALACRFLMSMLTRAHLPLTRECVYCRPLRLHKIAANASRHIHLAVFALLVSGERKLSTHTRGMRAAAKRRRLPPSQSIYPLYMYVHHGAMQTC